MGTLKVGDPFICGDYCGKVKSLIDDRGNQIKEAGPSTPVKVLGFTGLPQCGRRTPGHGIGARSENAERRALGSEARRTS